MSVGEVSALLFPTFIVLILLRVPVAFALGLACVPVFMIEERLTPFLLMNEMFKSYNSFVLLAVPFFILAGSFMTTGGVARRMIDFANALVGHYRGGLALAALLGSAFFAAVSGSATATVVAIGSVMIGGMVASGYQRPFAAGVICNAGTLGILIPPSLVMVVYGSITESSIGRLFVAGIVPGMVLTLAMMATIVVIARKQKLQRQERAPFREVVKAFREAIWGLMLLVIILPGIYAGIFTPTEAAAVAAVYAFVIAVFVYKDISLGQVPQVLVEASKITAMLMFIIANASLFAFFLAFEQIPQAISGMIMKWLRSV